MVLSHFVSTKLTQRPIPFESTTPRVEEHIEDTLHVRWRILISLLLLLLVALLSILLQSPRQASAASVERPSQQSGADRLVLAFYYTWFDDATWTYDRLSDLPAEPYVSRDRGVMGRHIDQARNAGIDAFVVAWYGPDGNQTEPNLAALLDEAAARGFKIAALFETDSPFLGGVGAATTALQHLLNVHASHPAYLRVDGRPVVFFWRPTLYGVQTWANIRAQADPNRSALWISEGVDTSYLSVFDGHHLYSNTWNPPADLGATNQKFAARVGADRIWVATVMPGYNDVKIRPGSGFARDREGGAYYERAWQAAIDSNPRWIVINSFNEWPEGSHIEPSAAFGDLFLGLTATWSARFKNSSVPGAAPLSASTSADAPVAETITEPTAIVTTAVLNLRAGPGTDFALLGRVVQGNRLPIVGRSADSTWWQVKVAGGDAWVFGELVRPVGIVDATPVVDSPMQPTAVQTQSASQSSAPTAGFTITVNGQSFTLRQVQPATP